MRDSIKRQLKELGNSRMTFKEISELTGIQITRVFRLIQGAEIKLNELEAFFNSGLIVPPQRALETEINRLKIMLGGVVPIMNQCAHFNTSARNFINEVGL